jgi:hypothetical protein
MLPTEMQRILNKIEKKESWKRTNEEKALLAELILINSVIQDTKLFKSLEETRVVSPTGGCPCCGRS